MYKVIFYESPDGSVPVEEYLEGLDDKTKGYIAEILELFAREGRLSFPLASNIEGPIWEIRLSKKGSRIRILYAIVIGKKILLLEGFNKSQNKTPKYNLKIAKDRLKEFLNRLEIKKAYAESKKKNKKSR